MAEVSRISTAFGPSATAVLVAIAVVTVSCTTVHETADSTYSWQTPAGFERVEHREDDERIFVVADSADTSAVIRRTTPAVPDALLPHLIAEQSRGELTPDSDIERSDEPTGWVGFWNGDGWTGTYAVSTPNATYALTVASEEPDQELLEELAEGFELPDAPQTGGELPGDSLEQGVGEPDNTELEPVGADGEPRGATVREVAFPQLITRGHLLVEPLTASADAESYAGVLLDRLDASDSSELEVADCTADCHAVRWSRRHDRRTHLLGVAVDGEYAYQIRLDAPGSAIEDLEGIHRGWLDEFLGAPEVYVGL